jgi:hypothetical protein
MAAKEYRRRQKRSAQAIEGGAIRCWGRRGCAWKPQPKSNDGRFPRTARRRAGGVGPLSC